MRVTINTPDELAKQVELAAKREGLSVSAYYVQAAQTLLRQQAFERMNELIGKTEIKDSFDKELADMRQDDPHR